MKNIHEVIKSLIQEGFTERQAETMAASFYNHNGNATKDDIKQLQNEMATFKGDIVQIRADMATKDDIKNMATKDDIKNMATKDDIKNLKWTIGLLIGILIAIAAVILGALLP